MLWTDRLSPVKMPGNLIRETTKWVSLVNKQILFKVLHILKYLLVPAALALAVWWGWDSEVNGEQIGFRGIFEKNFEPRWGPLMLAVVICTASMMLTFLRWYVLVRAQDLPFTVGNAIQLGLLGTFWSTILPGSVSGDIPKMVFMARDQSRRTVAVATIMIDRIVGLVGLIWLASLLGSIFWLAGALKDMKEGTQALEIIVGVTWILVAGSLTFWFLLGFLPLSTTTKWIGRVERIPKLGHSLAELCRATLMYRSRGRAVALAMLLAMVGHIGFALTFYFCSLSVNTVDVPSLVSHFLIVPVGATIQALGLTPGGLGVGELAFGELYKMVGAKRAEGVWATIMQRLVNLFLGALGFIVYLRMKSTLQAAQQQMASTGTAPNDATLEPVHPG